MMYCPSCGLESTLEQKFCRKCGFSLEPVSKLVTPAPGADTKLEKADSDRAILRRMVRWMMWGCLVLLVGLVMLVTGKAFDGIPKFLSPLASFFLIGGTAIVGYGVLAALRDGMTSPRALPAATAGNELTASSTNELPSAGIPISLPSVTERTTQLIERGQPSAIADRPEPHEN